MNKYDDIAQRYADGGVRDDQLDGTGVETGSVYLTRNYVALGAITQEQANAIRAGAVDPALADLQAQLAQAEENEQIITGGVPA